MASLNRVQLIGNLGRDPEARFTANGKKYATFTLAVNRSWKSATGEKQEYTDWFLVNAWGKLAEACNSYLKKGSQVYAEGRLIVDPATGGPRIWTRQDGSPAASFEIHADLIRFLGEKNGNGNGNGEPPAPAGAEPEIPF